MRILVNATTLVVGGGIQVGVSFIQMAVQSARFEWRFLVSKGIYDSLDVNIRNLEFIICIPVSPAKLIDGRKSRKKILKISRDWDPDLIYSIGFPSYIRFKQTEIGRYTNPWEINSKPLPWNLYPRIRDRIKIKLGIWYRHFWARKASYIETQTEAAKLGIIHRVGFSQDKIKVIPNSPNQIFIEAGRSRIERPAGIEKYVFCLAAPHPHKNISIVPEVAEILNKKYGLRTIFWLTFPEEDDVMNRIIEKSIALNVEHQIINLGKLKLEECLDFYRKADLVFLPTLMEIFSATYLEAMAMGVPIVTTDLDFAHDNCGDAALFFRSNDIEDAAAKIYEVLTEWQISSELVKQGYAKLNSYPSNVLKYTKLFDWFEEIIKD